MLEPISISLAELNINSLLPMIILIIGGLVILCIDLLKKDLNKSFYVTVSILFIVADLGAVLGYSAPSRGMFDVMLIDGVSIIAQTIILVASAMFIPLALTSKRFHEYSLPEYFALFLFMVAGMQFMTSSDNLILIFIGLETASLSLYALIAMHNRNSAIEAAIKYFTMGALAAGFYVFGAMILYAMSGSVELGVIGERLAERHFEPLIPILAASVFMIASIGFKIAMVPFHNWIPDVYEGSSAALAGYMAVIPKVAGFVVAIRFFEIFVHADILWVKDLLYLMAVVTMTFSNIAALVQEDVKRMLAYSSISHGGFVMVAVLLGTTQANSALFFYFSMYLFAVLGAFTMLWVSRHKKGKWDERYDHPYKKFSGMIQVMPVGAVIMAIFMLSLAGIPPFSVFRGKMYLISATVNSGYFVLAIIMAINSAMAVYYYLKLVVFMFFKEPNENDGTIYMKNASLSLKSIIGISVAITVLSVFFTNPLLESITKLVSASGY